MAQSEQATSTEAATRGSQSAEIGAYLNEHRHEWPLTADLVTLNEVIALLPVEMRSRSPRLHWLVKNWLSENGGVDLGQSRTPSGARRRIYAIRDVERLMHLTLAKIGAHYDAERELM